MVIFNVIYLLLVYSKMLIGYDYWIVVMYRYEKYGDINYCIE